MRRAFTLAELMISSGILSLLLCGLLAVFINCILLNETNRNIALAYSSLQGKMEEIKKAAFSSLSLLNGTNFSLNAIASGSGRIEVTDEFATLKRIRLTACFMNRNRLVGNNINNCSSSPVELVTLIAQ